MIRAAVIAVAVAVSFVFGWFLRGFYFRSEVESEAKTIVRSVEGTLVPEIGAIVGSNDLVHRQHEINNQSSAEIARRVEFFRRLRDDPEFADRWPSGKLIVGSPTESHDTNAIDVDAALDDTPASDADDRQLDAPEDSLNKEDG